MTPTRKILLTGLFVMFVCASANAGVSQPEDFESYALTNDWDPDKTADGITRFHDSGGSVNDHIEIVTGTNGNTSQVVKYDGYDGPKNLGTNWYKSIMDSEASLVSISYDWQVTGERDGGFARHGSTRFAGWTGWDFVYAVEIAQTSGGSHSAKIGINKAGGDDWSARLPGANDSWDLNTWYTLEVEQDTANKLVRLRHSPKGGTPYAWTSWLGPYLVDFDGGDGTDEVFRTIINGVGEIDNLSMTPEPGTLALLGLGSLLMVRRRRK